MRKSSVKNISTTIADNKYSYAKRQDKTPRPPLLLKTNTNRSAAHQRASDRTTLSQKILASITEAFILTDDKGLIKDTNKKLLDLLDYSAGELKGSPLNLILKERSSFDDIAEKTSSVREGSFNATLKARSKVLIPVDLSIVPYTDGTTGSCYTIILAKDLREKNSLSRELEQTKKDLSESISSLKEFREGVLYMLKNLDHSEKELQATNLELRETQAQLVQTTKLKALGELTAGLAHELNQPLTVIRGISQHLIRDFDEGSPQIGKLRFINSATKKMEKTISHLKAFSRLDDEVMININLNNIINNSLLLILEILRSKHINVKLDLREIPQVKGRPNRLEQVIINIITNARDAMPEGGTIEVASSATEIHGVRYATVTFKDTGYGIPEAIKERIFEPFFTTKDVNEGTGLGLSISYGIIKDHRGDIWFESSKDGTTFHISIPASSEDYI
ncbi:hypothetical protein MNBD_DELTA01-789 [hydrothermal vent metagenome]|uniref:Histidine kinase domain-containing protein n=1 Tax=hydrothermal vent metagenome TaxID=652676 RepID=A0A3B0RHL9_9ZZZZ